MASFKGWFRGKSCARVHNLDSLVVHAEKNLRQSPCVEFGDVSRDRRGKFRQGWEHSGSLNRVVRVDAIRGEHDTPQFMSAPITHPELAQRLEEALESGTVYCLQNVPLIIRRSTSPHATEWAVSSGAVNIAPAWSDQKKSGRTSLLKTVYAKVERSSTRGTEIAASR